MRQRVSYQFHHVLIRQRVIDVLSLPAADNDVLPAQDAKALGDSRDFLALGIG